MGFTINYRKDIYCGTMKTSSFIALLTTLVSCVTQKTIPEVIERFKTQ
jgi:hypothetical protein